MYMWNSPNIGELAGTNIENDLTLRKYMYNVLYINHTCNPDSILTVLDYVAYIFQKNFNSTALISYHRIIALCDGMLYLIGNQSIHSNPQNYDSNVKFSLIICTRYFSQKRFILVLYLFCLHFVVKLVL